MTLAKWINDPGDLAVCWSIDPGDSHAGDASGGSGTPVHRPGESAARESRHRPAWLERHAQAWAEQEVSRLSARLQSFNWKERSNLLSDALGERARVSLDADYRERPGRAARLNLHRVAIANRRTQGL